MRERTVRLFFFPQPLPEKLRVFWELARDLFGICFPMQMKYKYPSRFKSQFPAAALTLELLVGFRLGCGVTTVRTCHSAILSHNVISPLLAFSH